MSDKNIETITHSHGRRVMPITKNLLIPSSEEVRSEAIQMLIKRMGITKAAVFIPFSKGKKAEIDNYLSAPAPAAPSPKKKTKKLI